MLLHSYYSKNYTSKIAPSLVITSNLKWNDHCQRVVHRAIQSLNQLRRAMYGCTDRAKALAYLVLVQPHLEYCNVVWTLHTSKNIDLIESVQRRAARWIKSSFDCTAFRWTKSSSECLGELEWPPLELKCNYMCAVLLYAILYNFTLINFSDYFQLNDSPTHSHPLTILPLLSSINAFCYSFFVNSVFLWNSITFDVLSASLDCFKHNFCFDSNVLCFFLVYVCLYLLTFMCTRMWVNMRVCIYS